ncbi:hypothetical protein Swit_2686 [Rhizorhabdus wittichii RW1]|uniref:Uncharacterized protein n=1 Tax=Rhizorhabdus wittichii (strain DSM 6014 / CCUG 31198 / JCM 15750 / NBRC 105917 / EY 4224 / RW1) TaxID=392499 RepID=A0A9J9HCQ0_RHIWR|nr:hypothetical protein Swit_2686 [Rhizorhabdus wittichii RW1]
MRQGRAGGLAAAAQMNPVQIGVAADYVNSRAQRPSPNPSCRRRPVSPESGEEVAAGTARDAGLRRHDDGEFQTPYFKRHPLLL